MNVGDDAMGGEDSEAFAVSINESHHRALVVGVGIGRIGGSSAFIAVVESGFVTMMAVGDDELLIGHGLLNGVDPIGFGDRPEAVDDAIFVSELGGGSGGGFGFCEDRIYAFLRIGIQHEELAGMGASVAEEFKAVGFGAGECKFVTEDNAGGIFLETSSADEAAASALFSCAGDGELLGVSVKGGSGILGDDVVANPFVNFCGGAGVDVVLRRIFRKSSAFFDGDQILRVRGVVFGLALRRNLVVGLGEDAIERSKLGIEAIRAKREYLGHEFSGVLKHES